jgi:hypothetical protein
MTRVRHGRRRVGVRSALRTAAFVHRPEQATEKLRLLLSAWSADPYALDDAGLQWLERQRVKVLTMLRKFELEHYDCCLAVRALLEGEGAAHAGDAAG